MSAGTQDGLRLRTTTAAAAAAAAATKESISPVLEPEKEKEEVVWGKTPSGQGTSSSSLILSLNFQTHILIIASSLPRPDDARRRDRAPTPFPPQIAPRHPEPLPPRPPARPLLHHIRDTPQSVLLRVLRVLARGVRCGPWLCVDETEQEEVDREGGAEDGVVGWEEEAGG